MAYIGRFAPSPTGPLHFGSLLAALASYLDAKSQDGMWLLRMEDLDPPREPPEAADQILNQLVDLDLQWDGDVLYQSSRLGAYQEALNAINNQSLCFYCTCTRPEIQEMGSIYNGQCRTQSTAPSKPAAIRVQTNQELIEFEDRVFGNIKQNIEKELGDFVIKRKDGLFAYQLAVVVDDAYQNISHVVRGYDLIDSTPRQIYLQKLLSYNTPEYCHIPIVVDELGNKLSKQQFAEPINSSNGKSLVHDALRLLGQNPPASLRQNTVKTQLAWATEQWDIQAVPKLANIPMKALS